MNSSSRQEASPAAARACVLIVEDEFLIRMTLSEYLRDASYQVIEACDADEAIILMQTIIPDLIISDVRMPGSVDGLGLLELIRKTHPTLSVIITSAHLQPSLALVRGAAQFLPKPYTQESVIKAVQDKLATTL